MIDKTRFETVLNGFEKIQNIAVLGDVGVDKYTSGNVDRISPEAPVPVVEVKKEWTKLGLAANVSDNLSDLGVTSDLFGVIGNDVHGKIFEDLLGKSGLTTKSLVKSDTRSTTFKERVVAGTQQICRIDYETQEPIDETSKSSLLEKIDQKLGKIDGIILEDYGKGLFDERFTQEVIALAKRNKVLVTVDPSRKNPATWYKGATLFKPNFKEASIIMDRLGFSEERKPERICEILIDKLNFDNVVVTLGSEGMVSMSKDSQTKKIPTIARDVFDVSGAGDTSIAVLTAALISGGNLEEAVWTANLAAGVVVAKKGTATATIDEIKTYYNRLQ